MLWQKKDLAVMSGETLAFVNYYVRTGYWRHVQHEGAISDSIREFEALAARQDAQIALPVKIALVHAYQQSKVTDGQEVMRLQDELELEDVNAPDRARLLAGLVLCHLGEGLSARKHVKRLLQLQPSFVPAITLLGWLEIQEAGKEEEPEDANARYVAAEQHFGKALEESSAKKDVEALMGRAKVHQAREQHKEALDFLDQVVVLHSWFLPALVEKFQVLVAMGDWEQAVETAERVRSQDPQNIEALRLMALYQLSQESKYSQAVNTLGELSAAIGQLEPLNAPLYHKAARPFARLAGRHRGVLQLTLKLIDRACKLAPTKCEYAAEYGYQQLLLGDLAGAANTLRHASALEDGSQDVVHHQIKCQILSGQLDEAEQQLEFISAVQDSLERTPEMALCHALLAQRKGRAEAETLSLLDEALELHMRTVRNLPYDEEYFAKLNPDLLLEIARAYLSRVSQEPEVQDPSSPVALALSKATKLLQIITKQVPGLLDGQMLLARARFSACDFESALRFCGNCIKADPSYATASLLQAQIYLRQEREQQANAVLEQAVSHNFGVRESPLFHLVKAKVLQSQGELTEAEEMLTAAMKLPGVSNDNSRRKPRRVFAGMRKADGRAQEAGTQEEISQHDRCSIYLQLIEVQLALGKTKDAKALMQQAIVNFSEGPQEGRITMASAQVEVKNGKIDNAIKMLQKVAPDNPHYYAARKQLADLYLSHRNDWRQYAMCHEELVKSNPTVGTYLMCAEAYMKISEPQKAITNFELALRLNPGDATLASRIGKVLVSTHEYAKAIEYYSTAVHKDKTKTMLKYELAELYLQLKKFEQAFKEVSELILDNGFDSRDLQEVMLHVKALRLVARVHQAQSNHKEAVDALGLANTAQSSVLARVRTESPDAIIEQRQVSAQVCYELAQCYQKQNEGEQALSAYREALNNDDTDQRATLGLARLRLHRGELDEAQSLCVTLMRLDPDNQEASMILADLMLQKNQWDAAIYHFQELLEKAPADYLVLSKMIQLLRRAGRLQDSRKYIKQAERTSSKAALEPGLCYCRGLLSWYENNPRAALKSLNMARRDAEWGERAIQQMVQIYLNPENETNWDDLTLVSEHKGPDESVIAAEKLLRECPRSPRQQVLSCYKLLAYKTSSSHLEKAVTKLIELLNEEKDYVPALVCLSQAYLMLKQAPKARNYLKRVAKMQFIAELADDYERGWLMLADVYIVSGKYDLAEELCRRCLTSNKSCAKAWEFLGVVKEKEMSYKDAASHYENAWKFENEASASVGYKLSFNYLKAKKYVEAVDVCHKVLQQYPDYPKIKKDVLEKAWQAIRP